MRVVIDKSSKAVFDSLNFNSYDFYAGEYSRYSAIYIYYEP
jgi:hypothetical protein